MDALKRPWKSWFKTKALPEKAKKICPKHGEQDFTLRFDIPPVVGDYCVACIVENLIQPNAHRFDKKQ